MSGTVKRLKMLAALLVGISLAGCAGIAPGEARRDATLSLIRHPEFPAAAQAAPAWVKEALATITAYEALLASPAK